MTERLLPALLTIALVLALFLLMWLGWRGRSKRTAELGESSTAALTGEVLLTLERVFYVATTPAGARLERVSVPGLRYRGFATLTVATDGVSIALPGEPVVTIAAEHVGGVEAAQVVIDKVVEAGGLTILSWRNEHSDLESSFRFSELEGRAALRDALAAMHASPKHPTSTPATHTQEA